MSTTVHSYKKVILSRRALLIGLITLVSIALAGVCIWIMTDQTIAPPSLRILDFLWRTFSSLRA